MTDADLAKTTLMAESRAWRQVALILCESVRRRLLYQNSPDREQFFAELKQAFDEKLARAGSLTFPGRPAAESQMMADLFHEEWKGAAQSIVSTLEEKE